MILLAVHVYAVLGLQSFRANARQAKAPFAATSPRRFVQGFYDWYLPQAFNGKGDPEEDALKSKKALFSPELFRALMDDRKAQSKDPSEVVGLDFDPFLNSQDPAKHYSVGKTEHKGQDWLVSVYSSYSTKEPAVTAQVERSNGGWRFTNFLYGKGDNLLLVLRKLKKDRGGRSISDLGSRISSELGSRISELGTRNSELGTTIAFRARRFPKSVFLSLEPTKCLSKWH